MALLQGRPAAGPRREYQQGGAAQANAIQAVADVVRGHVRVTDPDDSDEEPAHYCTPPNVCIPPGAEMPRPKETIVKEGVPPNRGHDPAIGPPTNKN